MLKLLFPPSLGRVPASARAELLEQWFGRHLDLQVEIEVAPTYEALRRSIERREVDLAWAPPVVCAAVQKVAHIIFKAVRAGHSTYLAALVGREGELRSLDDLEGRHAAWVDRLSTAGYLLPISHLRGRGYDPDALLAEQSFLGSYTHALRAVVERNADVAAIYVRASNHEAARASIQEVLGGSSRLEAVDFTAEVPSDGLVVIDRPAHSDIHQVVDRLRGVSDGRTHTMLLTIFDADALEPAHPGEYDALREAVS